MKTYLTNLIPKIKRFSEKLDNLTLLTNQHWVVVDELNNSKFVYIFRSNSELLISQNGRIEKGKWEYLGNNSLLIERNHESFLFRHGFFDSNVLALKVDGKEEYAFLVNENNYGGELNSIEKVLEFLERKYLKMISLNQIDSSNENHGEYEIINLDKDLNPVTDENGKYGYLDRNGEIVITSKYDGAFEFIDGLALVYMNGKSFDYYGFIDESGKEVIGLDYEFGKNFSEGLAVVRKDRKFGYINTKGEVLIPFKYEHAESFTNGKARVKLKGRDFYIDKSGSEI